MILKSLFWIIIRVVLYLFRSKCHVEYQGSNLNSFIRNDHSWLLHHLEALDKLSESGAEVHAGLKLHEDLFVMVVGVRKQSIQTTHDVQQVLRRAGGDAHARVEVVTVVDDPRCVVQLVDHVVNGWALTGLLVSSTHEKPILVSNHLRATLIGANSEQLNYEEIQLKYKLSDVFVLPHTLVHFRRRLADFLHIRWVRSCNKAGSNIVKSKKHLLISSWRYSCTANGPFNFEMSSIPLITRNEQTEWELTSPRDRMLWFLVDFFSSSQCLFWALNK